MISEKKIFLSFSHYKSMGENDPGAWSVWTPGAWMAGFMKETTKHRYILLALGLMVSEEIFEGFFFSYIALHKHMTPRGMAGLEPIGMIYVGDH